MKIAIDISASIYDTGVSVYTKCLTKALLATDKKNDYMLFGGSMRRKKELIGFTNSLKGNLETSINNIPPTALDLLWNRLHLIKIEKFVGKIDVYHSSDWTQAPSDAYKVTTIHDTSPFDESFNNKKIVNAHKRRLYWIKREVDKIIVPSNSTKNDLMKLQISPSKITVIPEAINPEVKMEMESFVEEVKKQYGLRDFYLAVGANERKNTKRIIEAFRIVNDGSHKLVVVGQNRTNMNGYKDIIFTGHISRQTLNALYQGAAALLYPSLSEGFGFPILEAFFYKIPVVTSNTSAMKEIAEDAAILVDPMSVESIKNGIIATSSVTDAILNRGKSLLKKYSWEKAAAQTVKIYEGALK